jgi:DNA-binding winged helix-turn-helix (wHTH) protein/Tol biopolymer transport system component
MTARGSSRTVVSFGPFEADLHTQELKKGGARLRLPGQSFQILSMLLQQPGQLVSREELRQALWPAETFVDFEKGINAAIARLREALGDSAENPSYVETLPRRGYRFTAIVNGGVPFAGGPVAAGDGSLPIPARDPTQTAEVAVAIPPDRSSISAVRDHAWSLRQWISTVLSVAVLAVLAWTAWRLWTEPESVVERKLTTNSPENRVSSAAVSPDAKHLAYTDATGLYVKQIGTGEIHAVSLPASFGVQVQVTDWFPDGSHLLFGRPGPGLWSVSVFGGAPRLLSDKALGGSISPDGSHVAFRASGPGQEVWVMRSDGTDQVKVAADRGSWTGPPTWSPDGRRIAYIRSVETYAARQASVEVNEWRTPSIRTLFSDNRLGPSLRWLPSDRLVYSIGNVDDQQQASLWVTSPGQHEQSRPAKRITGGIGWISSIAASKNGKVLTFTRENFVSSILIGMVGPDGSTLLDQKKLTLDENQNHPSAWTPDSKSILFHSNRGGTSQIFKQALDRPLAESIVSSSEELLQPRMAPDGTEIVYISTRKNSDLNSTSSILAVPISGGPPRLILRDSNIWNIQCARLPSTLCMYSITNGDATETYRFDVKTGRKSDSPELDPPINWSLSPDGSQRAIIPYGSKGPIRFQSTLTGETRELTVKRWEELDSIDWSADGKAVFVSSHRESDSALLKITLGGTVSVLLCSSGPQVVGPMPSPDGHYVMFAGLSTASNVWMVENF